MVSFENVKFDASGPIYYQIIKNFKQQCAAGDVKEGDEMPSRRALSAQLGINPNTIQKAYKILEEEGLIASRGGAKSIVTLNADQLEMIRGEIMRSEIAGAVSALKAGGTTKQEALKIFSKAWDEMSASEGPAEDREENSK